MSRTAFFTLSFLLAASAGMSAYAEDYVITLKDRQFTPQTLEVPANQAIKLTVKNEQTAPAEFESEELSREKVVSAGSSVVVNIGPLKPGNYNYVDDFHQDSKGVITAK